MGLTSWSGFLAFFDGSLMLSGDLAVTRLERRGDVTSAIEYGVGVVAVRAGASKVDPGAPARSLGCVPPRECPG